MSFAALNKIQPFLVSITTSSVLLMDFHCHLTKTEVCGYLGGSWDLNTHSESIAADAMRHATRAVQPECVFFRPFIGRITF